MSLGARLWGARLWGAHLWGACLWGAGAGEATRSGPVAKARGASAQAPFTLSAAGCCVRPVLPRKLGAGHRQEATAPCPHRQPPASRARLAGRESALHGSLGFCSLH